tara:strand:+ start:7830 stop:8009 length:180 start_codon:yes stop_codon:yes gene_type:complete
VAATVWVIVASGDIGSYFFMNKQLEIGIVVAIGIVMPGLLTGGVLTVYMICRYLYLRGK